MLPPRVLQLVALFSRLPSVGEKTGQRFALHLACNDVDGAEALGKALLTMNEHIGICQQCRNIAEIEEPGAPLLCTICANPKRDGTKLCVVCRIQDLMSIERSGAFGGYYFVLGRLLSPLEGIRAADLPVDQLKRRIGLEKPLEASGDTATVREVLIATPTSVDGEATALLLARELQTASVNVTRLATGLPHGGDLEFADPVTIGRAIAGRRDLD